MATLLSKRLRQRLFAHHLPLFLASALAAGLLYITRPYTDILSKLSFATAYPALILLVLTLLIGPWNLLRRKRNPISSDLRRDFGIWTGILGLIHAAVGQCVHLRGRPWLYYVYGANEKKSFPIRHDLFGLANYTGLLATLFLMLLFATSNDYALRRLKAPRWKQLQRWNYLVFTLTGIHAIAYQLIETQKRPFVLTVIVSLFAAILMQGIGFFHRRQILHNS
ncbi:MAG TPA: ferric reductase-like transmembrane domain-containing protein [Acidobacteriaceae bacterium]|nr:ferric reductase-like transmembrane domain-containing protein [Acidobacteriaceae bacterium]